MSRDESIGRLLTVACALCLVLAMLAGVSVVRNKLHPKTPQRVTIYGLDGTKSREWRGVTERDRGSGYITFATANGKEVRVYGNFVVEQE